jgi:hypothetical protein
MTQHSETPPDNLADLVARLRKFILPPAQQTALNSEAADTIEQQAKRIAELEAFVAIGERFVNACFSAWSCGEPEHRVRTMLDRADEFRAALTGEQSGVGK